MVKTSPSSAGGMGSIPGRGVKIPHASQPKKKQNIEQKQCCNKFSKNFKNGPHQKTLFLSEANQENHNSLRYSNSHFKLFTRVFLLPEQKNLPV